MHAVQEYASVPTVITCTMYTQLVVAGKVVATNPHPSVNEDLLTEILYLKRQELEWKDILSRLRPRTVPSGYTYHPWKTGMIIIMYMSVCKFKWQINPPLLCFYRSLSLTLSSPPSVSQGLKSRMKRS